METLTPKILIVDDDRIIHQSFELLSENFPVEIVVANNINEAVVQFSKDPKSFAIAFIDHILRKDSGDDEVGINLVPILKKENPFLSITMMSGLRDDAEVYKAWTKADVDNRVFKPLSATVIQVQIELAFENWKKLNPKVDQDKKYRGALGKLKLKGSSKELGAAARVALKAAAHRDITVLVLGESGTGKELFAKGIHENSSRSSRPFLPVNCSQFQGDADRLEAELFGYMKGAFTGADRDKAGIFEQAVGGTVFLDEAHHLSSAAQAKLLRVLQEKAIKRLGASEEKQVDVRVICAAKPTLPSLAKSEEFHPDLYFRMKGIEIEVPPLRERKSDIPELIDYFLSLYNSKEMTEKKFSKKVYAKLIDYNWSGNVRELEQSIKALCVKTNGNIIHLKDLPEELKKPQMIEKKEGIMSFKKIDALYSKMKKAQVLKALIAANHNMTQAARMLGTKRENLKYVMKSTNISELSVSGRESLLKVIMSELNSTTTGGLV